MIHAVTRRGLVPVVFFLVLCCTLAAQDSLLTINEMSGETGVGKCLAPIGDYNNDGKDDIIVVSTESSMNSHDVIRIYDDSGAILATHHLATHEYLNSIVGMGDVDGDSVPDYAYATGYGFFGITPALGIPMSIAPGGASEVRVISGASGATIHTIADPGASTYGLFGSCVDNVGDIDGDGVNDFATSDPSASAGSLTENGVVYVYSGATGSMLIAGSGASNHEMVGMSISRAGDMNNDGTPDVLASFGGSFNGGSNGAADGAIVISGADGSTLATYVMPADPNNFGWFGGLDVVGGDDIDKDGTNDIVLSRSTDTTAAPNAGRIRMISGANGNVIQEFFGEPCQGIGSRMDLADINNDGHADVITGNASDIPSVPNEATVISGVTNQIMIGQAANATGVWAISRAGDINNDTYEDFMFSHFEMLANNTLVNKVTVVSGGPALGETAKSKVGDGQGQPQDVLCVDFKTGGQIHCVGCKMGDSITFSIDQPTTNAQPADFLIFGRIGVPMGDETYSIPGVKGDMTLIPAPMIPSAIPMLFTLASSVGPVGGGEVFQTGPAPWSYTMVGGINFPMEFTLEGIIMEDATTPAKTNAVIVRVH